MEYHYIDIHTHVNIAAFNDDWKEVIERARIGGVALINVGTQIDTSKRAIEIAEAIEDGVYATIGIHPVHTKKSYHDPKELGEESKGFTSRGEHFDISKYREMAENPKVVAIGECGLDYFRIDKDTKEKQEEAFIGQIELANELGKPLMLHIRPSEKSMDAYEDALEVIKRHAKVRGNVHFFAGTYEIAKKFWEIGFSTSFTGVITFADQYDEVVKNAPLEMLHGETDAPYVAPKPYRGQRNEPLYVKEVYKRIAELRGEDDEKVRAQLIKNAEKLFNV
jgi:TatD DNase family protein